MRNLRELDQYRIKIGHYPRGDEFEGAFVVRRDGFELRVIAAVGAGWDHVSVSLEFRVPTWDEMEFIKRLFFKDDEYAIQLHVPPTKHINRHPFVLHLWRPRYKKLPLPPTWMV